MHCLAAKNLYSLSGKAKLYFSSKTMMARIEKVSELTPSVVEGILRHSVSDVSLRVLDVSDPEDSNWKYDKKGRTAQVSG